MMNVFLIIVTLYIIVTLILFGIDFYYYIVEKYCRFHIGRYTSNSGWEERTIKKSIQWLKHTPTVRITDNNRYLLMDMLTAVMAYYYKNCAIIYNKKEYHDIYVKCMAKLRAVTRITGALDWCQGDTKGIGIFAKKFGVMPFAQGFLIRSFERKK